MFLSLLLLFTSMAYGAEFDTVQIDDSLNLPFMTLSTVPYIDSSGNIHSSSVSPTQLGYVDFTSSGQTQLNGKEPTITAGTSLQYWRGDKTWHTLDTSAVPENGNLYFTNSRAQAALSVSSPLTYSLGVFGCQSASGSQAGCLSSVDWNTFNNKEPAITSGTTSQYWRGDKSFQTLDTSVVPENGNLYYTSSRFNSNFAGKTTDSLTEGVSNLYYTNARAQAAVTASITGKEFYVSKDTGNDSNSGGLLAPFRTIQAGINACNALPAAYYQQCIVHVAPSQGGTGSGYAETVTFSQQGVNLVCDAPQRQTRACLISGQIVVNLSGVAGGANFNATTNQVYMSGFVVSATTTTNALLFSGTTYQQFISDNNYFDQNGSVSSVVVSNTGTSGGTGSTLYSYDTVYSNSNATNPTVSITSGARFWMYGTNSVVANGNASGPSVTQSGAGSSAIFNLVQLTGQYNLTDNTATATFNLSTIASGTNPCIVTPSSPSTGYALLTYFGCNSSNTNSITGSGIVANAPGNVRFGTSGDIVSTVTQAAIGPGLPQGEVLIGSGATTGTNVGLSIKDGHIKVAQTTAPTTTLSGNAGTGGSPACTITNGTDSDGKISLKTGTASWATGTQCTINFNKAWGVAPICTFSPSNDAGSTAWATQRLVMPDASTTAQTISAGVAFSSQVTATFHYHCGESQ